MTAPSSAAPLIVLAEDNPDLRSLLSQALAASGYRIVQAETGPELAAAVHALQIRGEDVGLIITDVRMPRADHLAALREIGRAAPLILMTAYGDTWTRGDAAAVGATLLDKPLRISELRDAVKQALK